MHGKIQMAGMTPLVLIRSFFLAAPAFAHPGSGIVVDDRGQIFFAHTAFGIWKVDTDGKLLRHEGPGNHFLALDADGRFTNQRWPRYREQMRPGDIRYGDAQIKPVGKVPTLLCATSFPIAVGHDNALYYPDVGLDERVHIKRLRPGGEPADVATLPLATEIDPEGKPTKALWIHGLAAGPDASLYYTEKQSVRRIDADGRVTTVAENIKVPDCTHSDGHRGGPILRGLGVAPDGTVYVAAMACHAVLRITPGGNLDVVLRAEDPWTPTGIAVKGDDLYVLEFFFIEVEKARDWRPRVRKRSPDGNVSTLATVTQVPKS